MAHGSGPTATQVTALSTSRARELCTIRMGEREVPARSPFALTRPPAAASFLRPEGARAWPMRCRRTRLGWIDEWP